MASNIWIHTEVENTRRSLGPPPLPNSKVRNRLIAEVSEAERIANIATMPPTTLYIP